MKKISFALLLGAICLLGACKKNNDTPSGGIEQPLQAAVKDMSLVAGKTPYHQASAGGEGGYRIHFIKSGTITKLGLEMATAGSYNVSFWRTSDKKLLATVSVTVSDINNFSYAPITNLDVLKDTSYVVSYHNPDTDKYVHWLYTSSPFRDIYPFTKGNVVIDQLLDLVGLPLNGTTPTYPYTVYSSDQGYIGASCDFVYQPLN